MVIGQDHSTASLQFQAIVIFSGCYLADVPLFIVTIKGIPEDRLDPNKGWKEKESGLFQPDVDFDACVFGYVSNNLPGNY